MANYEYFCKVCQNKFEQIYRTGDTLPPECPKCQQNQTERLISAFRVGGRGDLRESTLHGCHSCNVSPGGHSHSHSTSSHSHNSESSD